MQRGDILKSNFVKYIFFIFVIAIMGFAIYKFNEDEQKIASEPEKMEIEEEEIIKELSLGIAEYDTINPILSNNKYVQEISKIIYEPLFELDEKYKIKMCLARDWAKTSEVTYLIKIKNGIKWSNGDAFTVDDVIYTIDILKNTSSIYAYNVQYIIRVDKVDEQTFQIRLDHEIPFFEYNLIFPIMSKNYYLGEDFLASSKNDKPVGTGKYAILENNNENLILEKNENYDREELTLDTIKIGKYSNLGELYNAFKLGKVDLITSTNINIENYIGTIGYNKNECIGREFDFLAINTQNVILSHKEVRKAISYAINKENIVGALYNNKYKITPYPLDYGNWLNGDNQENIYNPDEAKRILEENGWEFKYKKWQKRENYVTRTINFRLVVQASNQNRVTIADMIKSNLEAIGINVTIVKTSDSQYQYYLQNKNYDMILTGTRQSFSPNLETYLGNSNLANYNNEEINNIMNEVKNITKDDLLEEKYKRIKEIYNEETPYIGLYSSYYFVATSWKLRGNVATNSYNIFTNINNWYKN